MLKKEKKKMNDLSTNPVSSKQAGLFGKASNSDSSSNDVSMDFGPGKPPHPKRQICIILEHRPFFYLVFEVFFTLEYSAKHVDGETRSFRDI